MSTKNLLDLFRSNDRSIGIFDPKTGKMKTEYHAATSEDVEAHLAGKYGIGLVPIRDDNSCFWAAIDIDNHGQDEDINIETVAGRIADRHLPLIACRSKSGGVHCYAFFEKPVQAVTVRQFLVRWAADIGFAGSEVFPKQSILRPTEGGNKQLGNWINLPYMQGDKTNRYAVIRNKAKQFVKLKLDEFISEAEEIKTDLDELVKILQAEHADAPPCVQRMMVEGVKPGYRNEALYQAVVYFRKRDPENVAESANLFNQTCFVKPLTQVEAKRTISSASRPSYAYRCSEEPAKSFCDRQACLSRKFGITPDVADSLEALDTLPEFSDLTRYNVEPIRWSIKVDKVEVSNISTMDLMAWGTMRQVIAERLMRIVPTMKPGQWDVMLNDLMKNARVVETPEDASTSGMVRRRLIDFLSRADVKNGADRSALLRGMPCLIDDDDGRYIGFRVQDFVDYLKRNRAEDLKGTNLYFAIKSLGLEHKRVRPELSRYTHPVSVWLFPLDEETEKEMFGRKITPKEFKSEI